MNRATTAAAVALSACAPLEQPVAVVETQRAALVQVVFQDGLNGYTGTRDTTLRDSTPDDNRGDQEDLRIGFAMPGDGIQVGLVRWDVSSIPAGTTVTAAHAIFAQTNASPNAVEARVPLRDWVELQATWNRASAAVAWATPGANGATDVGPPIGQLTCAAGACTLTIPPALAQTWVDTPAQNRGVLLRLVVLAAADLRLASRDEPLVPANRPILRLDVELAGDGGVTDGGVADGGMDAGVSDAGVSDAGVSDGGAADAGMTDAGIADGGLGAPRHYDVGCGCQSTAPGFALMAGLIARRRPRSARIEACRSAPLR